MGSGVFGHHANFSHPFHELALCPKLIMSFTIHPRILQVQVMSDCALLQYNKVWAKIRVLHSLNQSRQTLIHRMAYMQTSMQGVAAPHHKQTRLTLYEAGLLRDSEKLEQHQQSLEAAADLVAECKQATNSAQTFFNWVASLHESWQQAGYLRVVRKEGHMCSLIAFWPNHQMQKVNRLSIIWHPMRNLSFGVGLYCCLAEWSAQHVLL